MYFRQTFYNLNEFSKPTKSKRYLSAKKKIIDDIQSNSFAFINEIQSKNINKVCSLAENFKKFKNIIFLGTGGSSLGGKTLVSLKKNFYINDLKPKIFFIENVDQLSITGLIKSINLDDTALVIISKSGETIETLAQFFFIKNLINIKKSKTKIFVITENKNSTLKNIQEEEGYFFIEHNKFIGGRYSVFSVVGLLPAAIAGLKIKELTQGAKLFLENVLKDDQKFDDYFLGSFAQISLVNRNYNISVMMPYVDCLNNFSLWYRQLWAESIGKEKKGTTPISALGTVDQHSQLQLFLDGPKDKFFTILGKKEDVSQQIMDCFFGQKKTFELLHNVTLDKVMTAEMQATITTLKNKNLPLRFIQLEDLSENSIGFLMMFFLIETIFCCYLINVNPFDQPAVEEGKKLTRDFLKNDSNKSFT
ncbi:MAG: glucose-6-phosphate isomerase [Rickettsiales bacterium]|nr:glucose-6-phosphate isomerase [Rickettsiales bacterium]|tara:strand:+ start:222 stop:1481 length:1260 start_codon:yes stop_codon:yes gene_type:complete